jgi:hypothetical protein
MKYIRNVNSKALDLKESYKTNKYLNQDQIYKETFSYIIVLK